MSQQFQTQLMDQLPRLQAYAMSLTRNRHDAEDLVQTTAFLALRAEDQFIVGTNFSAWTYRILKNNFLSKCRSNKRNQVSIDDVPEHALARPEGVHDQILTREVIRAMDKLKPTLREVLTLICGSEMTYEEVATALDCSVGTVKSRMWRARAQMKKLLLGDDEDQPRRVLATTPQPAHAGLYQLAT